MEKVLNQILEKLNNIESEQKEQSKKLTNLDSKVSNLDNKVTGIEAKQKGQDKKLGSIETRVMGMEKTLNYHSEMFGALIHAQETQKAQLDKLEIGLAKLSGEQQKSFETLINMYGRHEFEITQLKQVK